MVFNFYTVYAKRVLYGFIMCSWTKETVEDESEKEEAENEESEEEENGEGDDPCAEDHVSDAKEGEPKHDSKDMPEVTREPQHGPGQIPETAKTQDVLKEQAGVEKGQGAENKTHEPPKVPGHSGEPTSNLNKDTTHLSWLNCSQVMSSVNEHE